MVVLVHAGNRIDGPGRERPRFPAANIELVRRRIGAVLDEVEPVGVVSAAAHGADLLFLDEAWTRRIACHVVLPCRVDVFRAVSVDGAGDCWLARYDRLLLELAEGGGTLEAHDLAPDLEGFRRGNELLLDRAGAVAGTDDVRALAVRGRGGSPATVTDDFVARARARGIDVVEVGTGG